MCEIINAAIWLGEVDCQDELSRAASQALLRSDAVVYEDIFWQKHCGNILNYGSTVLERCWRC